MSYSLRRYREDAYFRAYVNRVTSALPNDIVESLRIVELAAFWASSQASDRETARELTIRGGQVVPSMDAYTPPAPILPDACWLHWLEWQRHLGRYTGTIIETADFVVQKVPTYIVLSPTLRCTPAAWASALEQWRPFGALVQAPSFLPDLARPGTPLVSLEVALLQCAKMLENETTLPDGFTLVPVTTEEDVEAYRAISAAAYQASYGDGVTVRAYVTSGALLNHDHVRAWLVLDPQGDPCRVITGFISNGLVGAHAGAALPAVRGRHFSEPLLKAVTEWGLSHGCDLLVGAAMPQAQAILRRIGAWTVASFSTYKEP